MRAKSAASSGVASRTVIIAIRQAPLPRPYWSQRQRAADRLAVAVKLGRNYRPKETIDDHF
jgi:hypothetical protein